MEPDTLDTSPEAQATRRQSMAAQLAAANVSRVSELSPLCGQPVTYDGVAGTFCYIDAGGRFAADLSDGRRAWGGVASLHDVGGVHTFITAAEG